MRLKMMGLLAAGAMLCASAPVFAHHSFAMFDNTKWVTLKGTVVEYRWENPHMHIIVKVPPGADNSTTVGTWDIEGAAVNIMSRQGWSKISFKAGDPITAVTHAMKDGSKGASLSYVIKPDGSHMYMNESRPDQQQGPSGAGN